MKTLHLLILVAIMMVSLVAFGIYVIVHPLFGGIAPSPTFKGYIQIDTPELEKTYKTGQPINFSVSIQGFGLYPCKPPEIAIYNDAQTKPVFYYTTQSVSCPDSSEHYIFYFPSQNDTFSTVINTAGNYTVKISIGPDSYQKEFYVIPNDAATMSNPKNDALPVFIPCDTPYPKSNTGVAVLYMPVNSIGKLCVRYSNFNDFPASLYPPSMVDPNNNNQNAANITIWSDLVNNIIPKGNLTVVYWIKTGNQTGFYGLTVSSCMWTPFAVGYDNNSRIVASDFPFVGVSVSCPAMSTYSQIDGLTGIGVKYIPYP